MGMRGWCHVSKEPRDGGSDGDGEERRERQSKQQRTSNPYIVEIADCDDVEVYIEALSLMYCKDLRKKLMKEDVTRVLGILKFENQQQTSCKPHMQPLAHQPQFHSLHNHQHAIHQTQHLLTFLTTISVDHLHTCLKLLTPSSLQPFPRTWLAYNHSQEVMWAGTCMY
ncbi:BTB/POZ domain-containing protein [Camellia lanceoleosa]|uniref:BTB/POZ domain-containing protein n=1 Tax=Camellia lanceoleosa TaxID=1840588 RepID=A0ACC0FF28_9ERIC|nr:BTB/POZ domain-containing protein [Camellia lanceoleosa]